MKTIMQSIKDRVSRCGTPAECDKLDTSLNRLFRSGAISASELKRGDLMVCDRRTAIEAGQCACAARLLSRTYLSRS